MFTVTAISYMPEPDNRPFVASIEGKRYPILGTQYHPEIPYNVYLEDQGINHEWLSVQLNRNIAYQFVSMARQNPHVYGDYSTTQKDII
mmetsp:Transcript_18328/g.13321  ORF Transcript_18328/g.13321 Transcript_18328/m.13321 type:complete len:89 (+) Transcript_18328:693-959(+)